MHPHAGFFLYLRMPPKHTLLCVAVAVAALFSTVCVYSPGLSGGFFFDDFSNIEANDTLKIQSLDPSTLWRAAWSGGAGPLGRPVSMLSFALNAYFIGLDPYYFKLTNLAIHLLNGISVGLLTWLILNISHGARLSGRQRCWIAIAVAAAWLLHPFNMTAVLYVVQRMTSLAALFTFWGVIFYLLGRRRQMENRTGWPWIALSLLLCGPLAVLSKENGALLPLFLLALEFSLLRFSAATTVGQASLYSLFGVLVAIPALIVIGLLVLNPGWLQDAYVYRDFTLPQRLLTQARLLLWYLQMIVLPDPSQMAVVHDVAISKSLNVPGNTLPSILTLAVLLGLAIYVRTKAPLFSLGLLWFFMGHVLESTVLPLELTYEHRNYVPSYGIVLAVLFYMLYPLKYAKTLRLRYLVGALWVWFLAFDTWMRSEQWSDDYLFIATEVAHHPDSYRNHAILAGVHASEAKKKGEDAEDHFRLAKHHFEESLRLHPRMASSQISLIQLFNRHDRPIPLSLLSGLLENLRGPGVDASTVNAIGGLTKCQIKRKCGLAPETYNAIVDSILENPTLRGVFRANVLTYAADYYGSLLKDYSRALEYASQLKAAAPRDLQYRFIIVKWLRHKKDFDQALKELDALYQADWRGIYRGGIREMQEQVMSLRAERSSQLLSGREERIGTEDQ